MRFWENVLMILMFKNMNPMMDPLRIPLGICMWILIILFIINWSLLICTLIKLQT